MPSQIEQYLEFMAKAGHHYSQFLLKHGRAWGTGPQTYAGERDEAKMCFSNAGSRVIEDDKLTYVEGFATSFGVPIEHAWMVDEDGIVIDPTWWLSERDTEPHEYYGVAFSTEYLKERILETGYWGILDYNVELLKGEHDGRWEARASFRR